MRPLPARPLLIFAGIVLALPCLAADEPAKPPDPWAGVFVVFKAEDVTPRDSTASGWESPVPRRTRVDRSQGDRLWLDTSSTNAGWVGVEEVVRIEEADPYFSERINNKPDDIYARMARVAARSGGFGPEAEKSRARDLADLAEAIRLAPSDFRPYYMRSGYYTRPSQEVDLGIADATEALRLLTVADQRWRGRVLTSRAVLWQRKGDPAREMADVDEAVRLDPGAYMNFISRAFVKSRRKDHDGAIADFSEAIRLSPQAQGYLTSRATEYLAKGEPDRALADYDECLRLDPKSVAAYRARAALFFDRGEFDRAMADYDEAIRVLPGWLTYFDRAWAWDRRNERDRAIADYSEALRLNPRNAMAAQ